MAENEEVEEEKAAEEENEDGLGKDRFFTKEYLQKKKKEEDN